MGQGAGEHQDPRLTARRRRWPVRQERLGQLACTACAGVFSLVGRPTPPATMKGLFRRLGCLIIIILICVAVWYWYARVPTSKSTTTTVETATSTTSGWQPLTAADADRGRSAVQSLGTQS